MEHVWEDNSNWPPRLKIKLTEMSWKAYQAARQPGKQADENKDDKKKDNEEKAEDEASLAEHVDRSGAPRNAASKPVPQKSKVGPKTKAPAKSLDSWAALDRSSFKGRGWKHAGKAVLQSALKLVVDAHLEFMGTHYIVDGHVPREAGEEHLDTVLLQAPSYFENNCGTDTSGRLCWTMFSSAVYARLSAVRSSLIKKDARPLHKLMKDIMKHCDATSHCNAMHQQHRSCVALSC